MFWFIHGNSWKEKKWEIQKVSNRNYWRHWIENDADNKNLCGLVCGCKKRNDKYIPADEVIAMFTSEDKKISVFIPECNWIN